MTKTQQDLLRCRRRLRGRHRRRQRRSETGKVGGAAVPELPERFSPAVKLDSQLDPQNGKTWHT